MDSMHNWTKVVLTVSIQLRLTQNILWMILRCLAYRMNCISHQLVLSKIGLQGYEIGQC
jgi:hypothetical protein